MSTGTRNRKHSVREWIRENREGSIFVEKTKIIYNIETASLNHNTKQGDNNSNIGNRVKNMEDSISINNGGHEDKKNVIILGDSVIKHVNGYVLARKLDTAQRIFYHNT